MSSGHGSRASRRGFLADAARTACGAALAVGGLALYARSASSLPPTAIRPPGALDGEDFLAACVRCGLCVRECPYDTLRLAALGEDVATGTPYFIARHTPCEMCEDIPCVAACPTGALDDALTDIDDARMGLAVLGDQESCLNFLGVRCDVCYRVCPLIDEAISLEVSRDERAGHTRNPISMIHRGLLFGVGLAWAVVLAVAVLDLLVARRGWCGRLCPVGAFYGLIGAFGVVRVRAERRARCNDCMDCVVVCPEPHVIMPALKGEAIGVGPAIASSDCTACGRCIDVCVQRVFEFGTRTGAPRRSSPT